MNIIKFDMKGSIKIDKIDFDMSTISDECIIKNMDNNDTEDNPHPNLKLLAKDKDYIYKDKTYPRRITFGKRIPVGGEIIDIRNIKSETGVTEEELFRSFSNKNAVEPSITEMISEGLVRMEGQSILLTERGHRLATIYRKWRVILGAEMGG